MPSFENMKLVQKPINIGESLKEMSDFVIDDTFSNSTNYRKGKIYDHNMKEIKEIDFKFTKVATYTISKDQTEYHVQFRPNVVPEIELENYWERVKNPNKKFDNKHRLNFYLDIPDPNSKEVEKWLILGKDSSEFDRYIVLKCNWVLEWIDKDRKYHNCLGVIRDRNNYNSGVWSDCAKRIVHYNRKRYSEFSLIVWNVLKSYKY